MERKRAGIRRGAALRAGLAALTLLWLASSGAGAEPIGTAVERLVAGSKLVGKVGLSVFVLDADTGEALATHEPDRSMIPASNMKLLTSGAALDVLGPGFAFETALLVTDDEPPVVVVLGSGDPAFADPDLLRDMGAGVESFVDIWVEALADELGDRAPAEVVVDDRVFDRELVHPTWPEAQLNRRYCAEVAGLNFHRNVVKIFARPTEPGRPPVLSLEPAAPWLEVSNRARTVGQDRRHTAWASRAFRTNDISLRGDVRFATSPVEVTVHDPPDFFGACSPTASPTGSARRWRRAACARRRASRARAACTRSSRRCRRRWSAANEDSQNLYAESLLKRMGHEVSGEPGSWNTGAAVVRMRLVERLGSGASAGVVVADGSGMSRENRVTTRTLANWVRSLVTDPDAGAAFVESLPLAGDEGTLAKRFKRGRPDLEVRAKSGYLSGVSALTGLVTDPVSGRRVVFSIVSNDKPNNVPLSSVRGARGGDRPGDRRVAGAGDVRRRRLTRRVTRRRTRPTSSARWPR